MTNTYTQIFGGTTIYPSDVSYLALALTADTALSLTAQWSAASASNTLTGTLAQFNAAVSDADLAPVASPTFTGTLTTPTARMTGTSASGYIAGAGGAVTQITSRTTGVTLNSPSGQITMFNAAGSATWDEFEVTCSAMAIADTVILTQRGGTNNYIFRSRAKAGSFMVGFATTGGTASDAPLINYDIIKASTT